MDGLYMDLQLVLSSVVQVSWTEAGRYDRMVESLGIHSQAGQYPEDV